MRIHSIQASTCVCLMVCAIHACAWYYWYYYFRSSILLTFLDTAGKPYGEAVWRGHPSRLPKMSSWNIFCVLRFKVGPSVQQLFAILLR